MFTEYYLNRNKYNVLRDYEEQKVKFLLYQYKKNVLTANGFYDKVQHLENTSASFFKVNVDEDLFEEAVDVDDVYPMSLEEETAEIKKTALNLNFLRKSLNTYDYCRTRCKISNQHLRNLVSFPMENQMCFNDCLNIRSELNTTESSEEKTLVWLA